MSAEEERAAQEVGVLLPGLSDHEKQQLKASYDKITTNTATIAMELQEEGGSMNEDVVKYKAQVITEKESSWNQISVE